MNVASYILYEKYEMIFHKDTKLSYMGQISTFQNSEISQYLAYDTNIFDRN